MLALSISNQNGDNLFDFRALILNKNMGQYK